MLIVDFLVIIEIACFALFRIMSITGVLSHNQHADSSGLPCYYLSSAKKNCEDHRHSHHIHIEIHQLQYHWHAFTLPGFVLLK